MARQILFPKSVENKFKNYPLYSQEHVKDKMVICKFFSIISNHRWYMLEFSPEYRLFFAWVTIAGPEDSEFGYVSLDELMELGCRRFPTIERDKFFKKQRLSSVKANFPA